jgi:FAD/FMN-containing dehydrogenase/Fe-S oxidoreductase
MNRREIEQYVRAHFDGEARFDPLDRALYATDASNHQIDPLGVVFPKHQEHLQQIVEAANVLNIPLLPRGSGTSLSGAAVGEALILDCSKHMHQIRHINAEETWAELEPGVFCTSLNVKAAKEGLQFGPDPASADRATFGGMIGNNATGAHSIQYGMTADHVLSIEAILSDGSVARFEDISLESARQKSNQSSLEADIYRSILRIRMESRAAVEKKWPRTWRRASGYSLNYAMGYSPDRPPAWFQPELAYPPTAGINLAQLLSGSEGTLAIISKATVRLVRKPKATVLAILEFESVEQACDITPAILETEPAAVELIPRTLIQQARTVPAYARKLGFVQGDPHALLVIEYTAETQSEAAAKAQGLPEGMRLLRGVQEQADLWAVRKVGLGLLMSVPGAKKPITFIEDVAVPVQSLGEYVRAVNQLLHDQDTYGEWYAHASAGCLHLRPLINLKTDQGVRRMREIAEGVTDIVVRMRGAISGEHGDGLSHTEFNERLFGAEITSAFQQIKRSFDPAGLLNPGKVVAIDEAPPRVDQNLRYGSNYMTSVDDTHFAFAREGGFAAAVEDCTGVGSCRKIDGIMCPSFQATRDEKHSTRGRANALRAVISGQLPRESDLLEVLDLCLECKGCKAECPTKVDMARIKSEYLSMHHAVHGIPLRSRIFADIAKFSALAKTISPIFNLVRRNSLFRRLQELLLGIAHQREMPQIAPAPFTLRPSLAEIKPGVVLFVDTFTKFNEPEVGFAAVKVLKAAGFAVSVAEGQECCGRPMVSKGMLSQAKEAAIRNIQALSPYAEQGIPIIGLEPSCLLSMRDEYPDFFPEDPRAHMLANHAYMIEEFLMAGPIGKLQLKKPAQSFALHGHCHMKSLAGTEATLEMLQSTGAQVHEIDSGCCGMAGSFGYEAEHYNLSMQIGELALFPAARKASMLNEGIVAQGTSCRTQILDGTGERALHPIQVLASALDYPSSKIS